MVHGRGRQKGGRTRVEGGGAVERGSVSIISILNELPSLTYLFLIKARTFQIMFELMFKPTHI